MYLKLLLNIFSSFLIFTSYATVINQESTKDALADSSNLELLEISSKKSKSIGKVIKEEAKDTTITSKIKIALLRASNLKSSGIKVDTDNGHVILSGTVPTSEESSRAQDIAEGIKGVHSVQNRIRVKR